MTNQTRSSSRPRAVALLAAAALLAWWWWKGPRRAIARQRTPVLRPAIPRKYSGGLPGAPMEPSSYQETLDDALAETFPASDPISPSQTMRTRKEAPSARDPVDWRVERES